MKSLLDAQVRASIEARLALLKPDSPRKWGRMTPSQMMCHLTDAFRGALGELGVSGKPRRPATLRGRTVMKWWALNFPWPHGVRAPSAIDQEKGGTPPTVFEADRVALRTAMNRFIGELPTVARQPHFIFGPLSESEWAKWAYRHMDHHLRQFGL